LLHAHFRLLLVVLVDHLDREAADLAVEVVERELNRVAHIVADDSGRAAEGTDKADLDASLLGRSRRGREHGKRGSRKQNAPHLQSLPSCTMTLTVTLEDRICARHKPTITCIIVPRSRHGPALPARPLSIRDAAIWPTEIAVKHACAGAPKSLEMT